jgi:hypothetical protein
MPVHDETPFCVLVNEGEKKIDKDPLKSKKTQGIHSMGEVPDAAQIFLERSTYAMIPERTIFPRGNLLTASAFHLLLNF